jgi:hypothetical protein
LGDWHGNAVTKSVTEPSNLSHVSIERASRFPWERKQRIKWPPVATREQCRHETLSGGMWRAAFGIREARPTALDFGPWILAHPPSVTDRAIKAWYRPSIAWT